MAPNAASDCAELYKEARKLLPLAHKSVSKTETALLDLMNTKARFEEVLTSSSGRLKTLHNVDPLLEEARDIMTKAEVLEDRFTAVAREEKACKKTVFFRCKYVMASLEKAKLSLAFLLQRYISALLHVAAVATSGRSSALSASDWLYVLQSVDALNALISSRSLVTSVDEASTLRTLLHGRRHRGAHLHENASSSAFLHLRPVTSSAMLQLLAAVRSVAVVTSVARSVVVGIDRLKVQLAADEVSWLTVPLPCSDDGLVAPVTASAASASGTLPKSKKARESPTSDYASQSGSAESHMAMMEECVNAEDAFLNDLFTVLAQVPGLLNQNVLKSRNGNGASSSDATASTSSGVRISKAARLKMSEYYHDHLWQAVGAVVAKTMLWGKLNNVAHVPFGLQHPRVCLGLSNILVEHLYAKYGLDGYPPMVFPCMHQLVEAINLHVIAAGWDLQFLTCLTEATKPKTEAVPAEDMRSGTQISRAGQLFYDTLKATVRLNNRCHPDMIRDFVEHGSHDPEEYPFLEETAVLRRLLVTLVGFRNWAAGRSASALRSWNAAEFVLITQADLLNVEDCFTILQLETHERNALAKAIGIQLFVHTQHALAKDIVECERSIRALPEHNLSLFSRVCHTLTLATLKNVFPASKYWKQKGAAPRRSSSYVTELIGRILAPVLAAVTHMKVEIQQTAGRIAIKAFCEAWLHYIQASQIKFSDVGAHQLGLDFSALRLWLSGNTDVQPEATRYFLLLDSIRQCEGVAKLLLTKQGPDHAHQGGHGNAHAHNNDAAGRASRSNKVAPITEGNGHENSVGHIGNNVGHTDSPVSEILEAIPAELYVEDQHKWVSLRAGRSKVADIPLPFCCK